MKHPRGALRLLGALVLAGAGAGLIALAAVYLYFAPQLPSADQLRDVELQVPLRVYTRDGELIARYGEKIRQPVAYEDIPPDLVRAFLAAEDNRFFEHPGVDWMGILRAAWHVAITGEKTQGGSTITMQVARNYLLTRDKTYTRKIKEIFLALELGRELSKEQVFELYVNKIFLGNRAYGIGAAAEVYYGKELDQLALTEMAMLAGLPRAPSALNPLADPEAAHARRNWVLAQMRDNGFITEAQYAEAIERRLSAERRRPADAEGVEAGYVGAMVRSALEDRIDEGLYTRGLRVYTTLDGELQRATNRALRTNLLAYQKRHGYPGPAKQLTVPERPDEGALADDWMEREPALADADADASDNALAGWHRRLDELLAGQPAPDPLHPALVLRTADKTARLYLRGLGEINLDWKGLSWARERKSVDELGPQPEAAEDVLQRGDVVHVMPREPEGSYRLVAIPEAQSASVSLNTFDGAVLALAGGFDHDLSQFNRVTQGQRQPGSSFKPFLYSAALENGFTPATIVNDAPVVFESDALESVWRPENYSRRFFGPTRLREALIHSRNLVSIRVLREIGIEPAIEHITRFGFERAQLPDDLSLSLGSASVTPMQMARAFTVFASGGYRLEPYFIERVETRDGKLLFERNGPLACDDCRPREADETGPEGPTEETSEEPSEQALTMVRREAPERLAVSGDTARREYAPRVLDRQNAYLMVDMLRDVIRRGTGSKARVLDRRDIAGKTGTTDNFGDAWFNGFNGRVTTSTWVGYDKNRSLGDKESGARAALPMWIDIMRSALDGTPQTPLIRPPGMVAVRIDPESGKRAPPGTADAMFEVFRKDNVPELARRRGREDEAGGDDRLF